MKIDEIHQHINMTESARDAGTNRAAPDQKETPTPADRPDRASAEISISSASVEFNRTAEMMDRVPEDRAAKIDEIKARLQNGTYQVDADQIADKILKEALADLI